MMNHSVNPIHIGVDSVASTRMATQSPASLAPKTAHRPSPRQRLLAALTGLLPRNLPASNLPSGGATSPSSLYKRASRALSVTAFLAALVVGLLFLLPGGLAWAQDDGTIEYPEKGTGPVATYTAEDPEGTTITWSLEGTDATYFRIEDGVLSFKETPNYESAKNDGTGETANTYVVTVVATDSSYDADLNANAGKDTVEVTVNVTNEDEDGTLTLLNRQPVDGVELTTALTDIDSTLANLSDLTGHTWKWEKSTSRTSGWAVIDEATDAMYTPKPADIGSYLRATVAYTDPQGSGKSEMAVSDRKVLSKRSTNTVPEFRNADNEEIADNTAIAREVPENSVAGANVGAPVAAHDAQGDALTYTLGVTDEASFDIDQATGQLMVGAGTMLDFEGDRSYTVMVTATGPGHGDDDFDTIEVTITVTNLDEDPELTGMDSLRPAENTAIDTAVGTYVASDDEDGTSLPTLTLSGTDVSDFTLTDTNDDGTYELAFKVMPDFEMPADAGGNNVYNITVTATDSDGQTDRKNVTVTVTNVEEAGTVTLSTLQPRVGIGVMATLTDLDGAATGVTWAWEAETATDCSAVSAFTPDNDADDLEGGISGTYTPTADDIDKCLRATASYTDPQGSDTAMSGLTNSDQPVEEDDTNKAPAFPDQDMETDGDQKDQERTVAENTAANEEIGAAVGATDPNDDNLTYTLGGTDMASFGIARGTGQLMTKAMLNKEDKDTYMVTVTATDPSGLSDTISVTIKVTNVDEDPVIMRAPDVNVAPEFASATTSRTVAENTAAGEDIGTPVAANDANGDALTYALSGTDDDSFDIDPGTGQLMTLAALDYETKPAYSVTVTASDSGGLSDSIDVTITVTDVDDVDENVAPEFADSEDGARSVAENTMAGEDIGAPVAASDADDAALTYTLSGTDTASFAIDSDTGQLMTLAALDYETKATYSVTVTASDSGGLSDSIDVTITVTDVDEMVTGDDLVDRYDADDSGEIDKTEVLKAINDYLFGEGDEAITKPDVLRLINLYLFS